MTALDPGVSVAPAQHVDYYDHQSDEDVTCRRCDWSGPASENESVVGGELIEVTCPSCSSIVLVVALPTLAEIRSAAAAGNEAAIADLADLEKSKVGPLPAGPDAQGLQFDFSAPWDFWTKRLGEIVRRTADGAEHAICFTVTYEQHRYFQMLIGDRRTTIEVSSEIVGPVEADALLSLGFNEPGQIICDGSRSPNWSVEQTGVSKAATVRLLETLGRTVLDLRPDDDVDGCAFAS